MLYSTCSADRFCHIWVAIYLQADVYRTLVVDLTSPTVVRPPSVTALKMAPLSTLLHEHTYRSSTKEARRKHDGEHRSQVDDSRN